MSANQPPEALDIGGRKGSGLSEEVYEEGLIF